MADQMEVMMALLRYELCARELSDAEKEKITPDMLPPLYEISSRHDLTHLISDALWKNDLLPVGRKITQQLRKLQLQAVCYVDLLDHAFADISRAFEETHIRYLPLKGTVLRRLWPEPWMRTSCDIDILVHESDLERATTILTSELQYQIKETSSHDITMLLENGARLELHYNMDEKRVAASAPILSRIWDYAFSAEGKYRHDLSDEMFYFYHIAHMAKHLMNGGCGIRSFLDLWLLNHRREYDVKKRAQLIAEGGLTQFEQAAVRLSEVWLSGAELDDLSAQMEEYIVRGGVYGTMQNHLEVERSQTGSFRYFFSRMFPPYDSLKYAYPVLEKHKFLLPVMELRRLGKLFDKNRRESFFSNIQAAGRITNAKRQSVSDFLHELGL